jgi:hypothetical protein
VVALPIAYSSPAAGVVAAGVVAAVAVAEEAVVVVERRRSHNLTRSRLRTRLLVRALFPG